MTAFINIGTQEMVLLIVVFIMVITPLIPAILAIIDLFKRDFTEKSSDKILLILLIIFAPIIGSLVYFLGLKNNYPLKRKDYEAI